MNLDNSCNSIGAVSASTGNPYFSAFADFVNREKDPSAESLHLLFRYNPETGKLLWRPRPIEAFLDPFQCKRWNTAHANQIAGCEAFNNSSGRRKHIAVSLRWEGVKKYQAVHRMIWIMVKGPIPPELFIDHKDGDPFNNLLDNIRLATPQQNCQNRRPAACNTRGFKGVKFSNENPNRFQAVFQGPHKAKHLGCFSSAEEAALAYDEEAKKVHKEFACLNMPKISESSLPQKPQPSRVP